MTMMTADIHWNVFLMLTVLVCGIMLQSCNVTNLNDENDNGVKYFAKEHENHCYILVLKETHGKEARQMCRNIEGHLTDIDPPTQVFLESFITNVSAEFPQFAKEYWIGLLWSDALDLYYWDNGANYVFPEKFDNDSTGRCVVLLGKDKDFRWNNVKCNWYPKRPFICKIATPERRTCRPTAHDESADDNTTTCSGICNAVVIDKKLMNSTPQPLTTSALPDSTTSSTSTTNVTDEDDGKEAGGEDGGRGSKEGQKGEKDEEKSCCNNDVMQVILLPAVLAAVLAFSLLVNIVMACVLVRRKRKYRALKYKSKKAVPMVDILNADKVGAHKELRSQSDTSQLCSTDELLYANDSDYNTEKNRENEVEGRGGQATKNDNNFYNSTSEGKGNVYGNSQINGATCEGPNYSSVTPGEDGRMNGKSSSDTYAEPIKIGGGKANASRPAEAKKHSDKTPSSAKSNETYSTLNRNSDQGGGNLELSAMDHVYGMQSASAPFSGSDAPHSTGTKDTGSGSDTGSDEYSKLNRGERSANAGDPQHVYGLQSASVPFDDTVEYHNQETKNQSSVYESYT